MSLLALRSDARAIPLRDESVHCVITSPPYWGLRDYGVSGQIGLEGTVEDYVQDLVDSMREVRRVLRPDGTLWLNLGDCYLASPAGNERPDHSGSKLLATRGRRGKRLTDAGKRLVGAGRNQMHALRADEAGRTRTNGLKLKDLVGVPWRVAFALQADGWWLRSDVVWAKPNPMPESVRDRPTRSHEYVFLLAKSRRYYYDADAVREPWADERCGAPGGKRPAERNCGGRTDGFTRPDQTWTAPPGRQGRNRRTVWTVSTRPYPGAHFAVFPADLVEPCVLAGCPEGGVVLDPFCGTGTVGRVAIENCRQAVLCDISQAYLRDHLPLRVGGTQTRMFS